MKNGKPSRRVWITIVLSGLVLLLGLGASPSSAITLSTPNIGGLDCCTGPYATATVALLTATTATVTFDSLTNGGFIYLMGAVNAVALNVNASTFTASATGSNSILGFTPGPYTNGGSGNVAGFGIFN